MDHQRAQGLLDDFVDGTLTPDQTEQVAEHITQCAPCRHEVEQLRALLDAAARLPDEIDPPQDLWPGIVTALTPEPPQSSRGFGPLLERLRPSWALWPAAALAAGLAVVLLVIALGERGSEPGPPGRGPAPTLAADIVTRADVASSPAQAVVSALEAECSQTDEELQAYVAHDPAGGAASFLEAVAAEFQIIDQAIDEARAAWTANPNCPRLVRLMVAAYRAKAALQGRAIRAAAQT